MLDDFSTNRKRIPGLVYHLLLHVLGVVSLIFAWNGLPYSLICPVWRQYLLCFRFTLEQELFGFIDLSCHVSGSPRIRMVQNQ